MLLTFFSFFDVFDHFCDFFVWQASLWQKLGCVVTGCRTESVQDRRRVSNGAVASTGTQSTVVWFLSSDSSAAASATIRRCA